MSILGDGRALVQSQFSWLVALCLAGSVVVAAASVTTRVCQPGDQDECACPNGGTGVEVCQDDGSGWSDCRCDGGGDPDAGAPADSGRLDRYGTDAGPLPDGAIGAPCPAEGCHPALAEVRLADGGCQCLLRCAPSAPVPRCEGWTLCAELRTVTPDGGVLTLDAGVCVAAGEPGAACSPTPCAETLICARLAQSDAGNTCRHVCQPSADAAVGDVTAADALPAQGECPQGERCFAMGSGGGACFTSP